MATSNDGKGPAGNRLATLASCCAIEDAEEGQEVAASDLAQAPRKQKKNGK